MKIIPVHIITLHCLNELTIDLNAIFIFWAPYDLSMDWITDLDGGTTTPMEEDNE